MPHCCYVPQCNANYNNDPKISVLGFPKDEKLKQKSVHAIKRVNFKPSAQSKVRTLFFYHDVLLFAKLKYYVTNIDVK